MSADHITVKLIVTDANGNTYAGAVELAVSDNPTKLKASNVRPKREGQIAGSISAFPSATS